ncbi:MotA/TolQ/ExbB proton channel family protein [Halomonas sp. RA08-2]|uniref:MotA/TolQ/ExbB proton channel family protein n=1 Tax=Halomonas sp. RA08-2 TaxID=3440842 RepID=UPI003EEF13E6
MMLSAGWYRLLLGTLLLLLTGLAWAQGNPLDTLRAERLAAEARDVARLQALLDDTQALETALAEAREANALAQARHAALQVRDAELTERRAILARRHDEQDGELAAALGVLARHSGELRNVLAGRWVTAGGASPPPRLDDVETLTREHLETFADALMAVTAESGRIVRFTAPVADGSGALAPREVVRLGDLAAFSDGALLRHGAGEGTLATLERTPRRVAQSLLAFQAGEDATLMVDPTGGQVIEALAQRPTLVERFHQGGGVGYVVVGLGSLGLLVALTQYAYLLKVSGKMRRQRRHLDQLRTDNPLGRVLTRFQSLPDDPVPEALEARLDEAVLAELPRLERGQSLVKLTAAVAPLLGLLGTVTGMIATFQAITFHGTGDPQLMAGGISQALVTTVLGLMTAVPLLFAHTALVARSRQLTGVVEGRATAALAQRLEEHAAPSAATRG